MRRMQGLYLFILILVIGIFPITACSPGLTDPSKNSESTKKIVDMSRRVVEIPQNPQRIVTLSGSNLNLLYAVGGRAVGTVKTESSVPKEAEALPIVGTASKPNLEAILSLEPDIVIGVMPFANIANGLETLGIPMALIRAEGYEETLEAIGLIGEITNNQKKAKSVVDSIEQDVKQILKRVPQKNQSVLVLAGSTKRYLVALPNSFTGELLSLLNAKNASEGISPMEEGGHYASFSMEAIVSWDPDIILMLSLGKPGVMEQRLTEDLENKEVWNQLKAVKNKNIYSLPYELFTIKPGVRVVESIEFLAKILYPEVF